MKNDLHVFDQFMKTRESVAQSFVNGEFAPLRGIVTEVSPATFFGPDGDYVQGADPVLSRYEHDAGLFESGSTSLEVLHAAASGELAFWVGLPPRFLISPSQLMNKRETVIWCVRASQRAELIEGRSLGCLEPGSR